MNVLEIKYLRSMVGVMSLDRVKNEEVRGSWNEKEIASRVDRCNGLGKWEERINSVPQKKRSTESCV